MQPVAESELAAANLPESEGTVSEGTESEGTDPELAELEPAEDERRETERVEVRLPGSVAIGNQVVDCELTNLSLTGAKLIITEDFQIGSPAFLQIHDLGEFPGEIIWRYNDKVGFAFSWEHAEIAKVIEMATAE